jgi:malonyl-ACP decarboxylase
MPSATHNLVVSGIGITSAIGQGADAFAAALFAGETRFDVMRRPGRACADEHGEMSFIGAEIGDFRQPPSMTPQIRRTASWSAQLAAATLAEAWDDARLDSVDPTRIGLVIGGSNLQQRELWLHQQAAQGRERYTRPTYASTFLDSDLCGICSELFGIRGGAYTVGAASASGQVAAIHAAQWVASGALDVCISIGGLLDLSHLECQAMRSAGAMGSDLHASHPTLACRPFDTASDGFIFGEATAAIVVERAESATRRGAPIQAGIAGWASSLDGRRGTQPSVDGQTATIAAALAHAGLCASDIDYVNPHGTGSVLGDRTEAEAIARSGLGRARVNTTKSITGHGLSAAGAVELVATILQMRRSTLHPSVNLVTPVRDDLAWVGASREPAHISHALNLSMGFGGINTALCLRHPDFR